VKANLNGIGCVSPQQTWDDGNFLKELREYNSRMIQCLEPDTATGLDEKYTRRMNRLLRLGWLAAKICLEDAGNPSPDAIITGSGWGSVEDSERFLLSIYKNKENLLPPTPFIQSTHNALGSQIAILLGNYRYNMAYAHGSAAFEHALADGLMRIGCGDSKSVLLGGFDEITPNQFILYDRLGKWRKGPVSNLGLLANPGEGTIAGEGFSFFLLGERSNGNSYGELIATDSQISDIIDPGEIDWVVAGMNGDRSHDAKLEAAITELFPGGVNLAGYKHLCGEYLTSSAFALCVAAKSLRAQHLPEILQLKNVKKTDEIRNILIFNVSKESRYNGILLRRLK
jgi:3-oxoacyl-(acyl-carrier-protein) synthase